MFHICQFAFKHLNFRPWVTKTCFAGLVLLFLGLYRNSQSYSKCRLSHYIFMSIVWSKLSCVLFLSAFEGNQNDNQNELLGVKKRKRLYKTNWMVKKKKKKYLNKLNWCTSVRQDVKRLVWCLSNQWHLNRKYAKKGLQIYSVKHQNLKIQYLFLTTVKSNVKDKQGFCYPTVSCVGSWNISYLFRKAGHF